MYWIGLFLSTCRVQDVLSRSHGEFVACKAQRLPSRSSWSDRSSKTDTFITMVECSWECCRCMDAQDEGKPRAGDPGQLPRGDEFKLDLQLWRRERRSSILIVLVGREAPEFVCVASFFFPPVFYLCVKACVCKAICPVLPTLLLSLALLYSFCLLFLPLFVIYKNLFWFGKHSVPLWKQCPNLASIWSSFQT